MLPIIFQLGPITFYTIGPFLFLGFFLGLFAIWKRGIELRFDEEQLFTTVFTLLLWMLIGSRIAYVVVNYAEFGLDILVWLNILGKPGFLELGAMIGLLLGIIRHARKRKWDVYSLGDVMVVGLAMAQIFLSIGAFFNGSGFGQVTTLPWGVTLPGTFDKRHPSPLYEVVVYLIIFSLLWKVEGVYRTYDWYKGKRSQAQTGFLSALYCMLVGFSGLLLGWVATPMKLAGVRVDVWWHLILLLFGTWLLVYRSGNSMTIGLRLGRPVPKASTKGR